jgi:ABC-type nitrate/sulfonate/bicarbonate transport system substrate-binding protein
MKKERISIGRTLLLTVLLAGFVQPGAAAPSPYPAPYPEVTLRVGFVDTTNGVLGGVPGIAHEQGYFQEELAKVNAKIKITGFVGAGPAINAALASNSLDAGSIGDVPAIVAKANGADTIIVTGNLSDYQTYLLAQPGFGYKNFKDLRGKKIATQVGAYMHRTLILMLQDEGMTIEDINFVNLSANDARTALAAKSVDAIVVQSTAAISLIFEGLGEIVKSTEGRPDWLNGSCGLVSRVFAEKYPQVVTAYVKALIRASEYAADGHQDLLRDLSIRGGITPEQADAVKPKLTDYSTDIHVTNQVLSSYKSVNQFLKDNDLIPELVDIDSWYDSRFYEQALKDLRSK